MGFDLLYWDGERKDTPLGAQDMAVDLKMDILWEAMAGGDGAVYEACKAVMMQPLRTVDAIMSRRQVVQDAIAHEAAIRAVLDTAGEAIGRVRAYEEYTKPKYDKIISNSNRIVAEAEMAMILIPAIRGVRKALGEKDRTFSSDGFGRLCESVKAAYSDAYLSRVQARIEEVSALKGSYGMKISGHVGEGLRQEGMALSRLLPEGRQRRPAFASRGTAIPLASVALVQNAQEIIESALARVLRPMAAFNRSALSLLKELGGQLRFYAGCARLKRELDSLGVALCYPDMGPEEKRHEAAGLVDAGLALKEKRMPVSNDICLTEYNPVLITGPNQGGKATFLRSVGIAQVMAQCGMFVPAARYLCPVYQGIFTHFPSGEDESMHRGLLEMELSRLSRLIDGMVPGSLLLMNETFQTTMPGDAKQLAEIIVPALCETKVKVLFVTHLYGYAMAAYQRQNSGTLFLLAQRGGKKNTYRMAEGQPYKTAFGVSLFEQVMREG